MGVLKGDFIGFSFNGIHSSSLGIVRTDNGGRFTESLSPASQDKVVQIPGGDGSYFLGSSYTQKDFSVSFAFDSITEQNLRKIKEIFNDKKPHFLVFDETPYKTYIAKVTELATINFICFDEGETHRLYKGEGTIQFTAYMPFAFCENKTLNYYIKKDAKGRPVDIYGNIINYGSDSVAKEEAKKKEVPIDNREEWAEASGLLEDLTGYDTFEGNAIKLYNPGDLDSDWQLFLKFITLPNGEKKIPNLEIKIDDETGLLLQEVAAQKLPYSETLSDDYLVIDSKTNLLEGYFLKDDTLKRSGNIYNFCQNGGTFFKLPKNMKDSNGKVVQATLKFSQIKASTFNEDQFKEVFSYNSSHPLKYYYYYY